MKLYIFYLFKTFVHILITKRRLMKQLLILILMTIGLNTDACASGCDSYYFNYPELTKQTILNDYGDLSIDKAQIIINSMFDAHKNALHSTEPIVIKNKVKIKLVESTYEDLTTDCGWPYFKLLIITHLEIESSIGKFLYPEVSSDIDPQTANLSYVDKYVRIK